MVGGMVDNVEQGIAYRIDEWFPGSGLVSDVFGQLARGQDAPRYFMITPVYRCKCVNAVIIPYAVFRFPSQYTVIPDVVRV